MKNLIQNLSVFALCLLLASCGGGSFEPIAFGKDACAHCRMTIMDGRFATEWISDKGKVFKFDDLRCAREMMTDKAQSGGTLYVADFAAPGGQFPKASEARFVQHQSITSPMGGGIVAFASDAAARKFADSLGATVKGWTEIQ